MAVSTAALRNEFPEFVLGWDGAKLRCDFSRAVHVRFLASPPVVDRGYIDLRVHPDAADAFAALAAVTRHHSYAFREPAGGTLSCRGSVDSGGKRSSAHAHGVAIDFNPSKNGYRSAIGTLDDPDTGHKEGVLQWGRYTDMDPAMVKDIEAIRTKNGKVVWQWGGRWYNVKDAMHFQIACHRSDLRTGIDWSTVKATPTTPTKPPTLEDDEMTLKAGDRGKAVEAYQKALMAWNPNALPKWKADGSYGPPPDKDPTGGETGEWVRKFQAYYELPTTGVIDGVTADLLGHFIDRSDLP